MTVINTVTHGESSARIVVLIPQLPVTVFAFSKPCNIIGQCFDHTKDLGLHLAMLNQQFFTWQLCSSSPQAMPYHFKDNILTINVSYMNDSCVVSQNNSVIYWP